MRRDPPQAGIGIGAEARLVVGMDRDAAARRIGAELLEGVAVVVEAMDGEDHRARRRLARPRRDAAHAGGSAPGGGVVLQAIKGKADQEKRDPLRRRRPHHPAGTAGAGSGRPSSRQISSGRRPDWRSVRRVTARLRLASRSPVELAIRLWWQ